MKLLMISTDRKIFEKGSAVALRQIEYAKKYEEVHIIIFAGKESKEEYRETVLAPNLWVYPTRSRSRWMYVFDALKLARFIASKRGITNITCQDPFETGLVGALVKGRHPIKLELQIHTDIGSVYFQKFTFLNRVRTLISKYTLPRADNIRVVSERIRQYVAGYADPSKIEIRPITVDVPNLQNIPASFDLHQKYPQFGKIVLMVSRLEPEKNIEMAIKAFKMVLEKVPDTGLIIVGSGGSESKLKNLAIKTGVEKSVIFAGWQNDTASYFKTCDAFLATSWYEGYGMTFIEAKSAGKPIVSTDVGIARESGATIVSYTPESIAYGIIAALTV